jgi:hypothetical protein
MRLPDTARHRRASVGHPLLCSVLREQVDVAAMPDNADTIEWMPVADAAALLGVDARTVQRRVARGTLRSQLTVDGRRIVGITPADKPAQASAAAALAAGASASSRAADGLLAAIEQVRGAMQGRIDAADAAVAEARRDASRWRLACAIVCLTVCPAGVTLALLPHAGGRQAPDTMPGTVPASTSAPDAEALALAAPRDWHPPMLP